MIVAAVVRIVAAAVDGRRQPGATASRRVRPAGLVTRGAVAMMRRVSSDPNAVDGPKDAGVGLNVATVRNVATVWKVATVRSVAIVRSVVVDAVNEPPVLNERRRLRVRRRLELPRVPSSVLPLRRAAMRIADVFLWMP